MFDNKAPQQDRSELERRFTDNLNYWMSKKDVSQANLARALNISTAATSQWSTGRRVPRMDMVERIAGLLNIPVSELFKERNNGGYYINDDVKRIANEIAKDSDLMLLFKTAKHAGPEGLKIATDMLEALRRKEEGDDDGDFDQVRHLEDAER